MRVLMIIVFCFAVTAAEASETFRYYPVEDTWANQANPAAGYADAGYLTVKDTSKSAEAFFRFDAAQFAGIEGKIIESARFSLFQYAGTYEPGDSVNLWPVIQPWRAGEVTWNSRPLTETKHVASIEVTSGLNLWRTWEGLGSLVDAVRSGSAFGFALENDRDGVQDELYSRFYSIDSPLAQQRPYLELAVSDPLPPPKPVTTPEPLASAMLLVGSAVLWARCSMIRRTR